MEIEVGNGENKLFGGAQYHRALREFNFAIRHMNAPEVREEDRFFDCVDYFRPAVRFPVVSFCTELV